MPQAFQEVANPGKMLKDMFGSIPSLPPWHSLNLGQEQQMAADNNLAILPKAAQLANMTEQQIMSMMGSAIPGFDAMRAQASSNISSELKGQIPKDVQDAISNSAAARALGGGFGGSGMHGDLVARDLGITSLNLMDKGLKASESWMAATERMLSPAIAEYTNMFVTPGQQAAFDTQERDKSWAYQWLGNQLDSMPNPGVAGMTTGLFNSVRGNASSAPQTPGTNPADSTKSYAGTDYNEASGWETAGGANLDMSMFGAAAANQGAGVSAGYDWTAGAGAGTTAAGLIV